ncbi:IclR family transcriptional regulator [Chitinasiproducens palmae]|uniref:DNA-binding transcriptional regulator, IclR family n=1 Tax=Chitinasiproducens palmae TaxID=1770053 RepID=A0A1H2PVD8_9BURK|nr:IclR family transcriptional regulator C-terminal domain-containing protein [Chitinasiproducens palmae]SDV51210.1 DNA-binding transcriptional regulator, IclR family [Chitinasiproducens palmae]
MAEIASLAGRDAHDRRPRSAAEAADVPGDDAAAQLISPVLRGMRLLRYVASGGVTANLSEAARQTGINRVTLARLLDTFVHDGTLEAIAGGGHRIGTGLLTLAADALAAESPARLCRRALAGLAGELGLSAYLAVLDGADVVFRLNHMPDAALVTQIRIGSRVPALRVAPGRVLVAFHADAERTFEALTAGSDEAERAALRAALARDREHGHAWSFGGLEADIDACAVPVRDADGHALAAISVAGPAASLRAPAQRAQVEAALAQASQTLSSWLAAAPHDRFFL